MNRSLKLARIAGISIFIHWTFLLLPAWVFYTEFHANHGTGRANFVAAAEAVGFILSIFFCVVLHELGHAFAARRFGIRTRDITLLPIGGVARLERIPEKPGQELVIALAGPLVNVLIAGALFPIVIGLQGSRVLADPASFSGGFLLNLLRANILLVVFNLIPAFPMDGGRVLRALLAFGLNYVRATLIAARVGQAVAIVFAVIALWPPGTDFLLVLVAAFVFMAAQGELQSVRARSALRALTVRDAGVMPSGILHLEDPVADAMQTFMSFPQQVYPVADGDRLAVVSRANLMAAASSGAPVKVRDVPRHYPAVVEESDSLESAIAAMNRSGVPVLAVLSGGRFAGFITVESITRVIKSQSH